LLRCLALTMQHMALASLCTCSTEDAFDSNGCTEDCMQKMQLVPT
jgi:hypothetical protein